MPFRASFVALILLAGAALPASAPPASAPPSADYRNAQRKFQQIETQKLKPGTRIALTPGELNAWIQTELPNFAPDGVSQPVVRLQGNNTATGSALVNFVRLRSAQGKDTSWLLRNLLNGEHEIRVTAKVASGGGRATVQIVAVELAGLPISGSALDFLIQNYLIPNYPDAKIGKPFPLKYRMDRIEVGTKAAYVVTR